MDYYIYNNELYHWGVKGMKWGVRRYQNKDGTLTAAGKKRLAAKSGEYLGDGRWTPNPSASKDRPNRSKVANSYLRKRTKQLDSLDLAESYLDEYSKATLRDLGMEDSESARAYVKDLFSKSSRKLQALREEENRRNELEASLAYELEKVPAEDRKTVTDIARRFIQDNDYGWYESESKTTVGGEDIFLSVLSTKGREVADSLAASNFLKKYDLNKAREGVAKEYYDEDEYGVINKKEISREEFLARISPGTISIDPRRNDYEVWWNDDGMYGYHSITDYGSLDDMIVRGRALNG